MAFNSPEVTLQTDCTSLHRIASWVQRAQHFGEVQKTRKSADARRLWAGQDARCMTSLICKSPRVLEAGTTHDTRLTTRRDTQLQTAVRFEPLQPVTVCLRNVTLWRWLLSLTSAGHEYHISCYLLPQKLALFFFAKE